MKKHHPSPVKTPDFRMAGFHYTVAGTIETIPNTAILTYHQKSSPYMEYSYLLKIMPCLELNGKISFPSSFTDLKVEDFPGGVCAEFKCENIEVTTRVTPLLAGRGAENIKGCALYEIETKPPAKVVIHLGTGKEIKVYDCKTTSLNTDEMLTLNEVSQINAKQITCKGGKEDTGILVSASEEISILENIGHETDQEINKSACIHFENGSGAIVIGFSDNNNDLAGLVNVDVETEKTKVAEYYQALFQNHIETPEPIMDEAFKSAIYNLEYSWFEPFGWGECLHHWLALWHMQVGAAADLIGQKDRSKSCILEHAYKLFPNGAVPQFMPNKTIKRDFGGSNAYWVWQIRHYLHCSGDRAFAEEIIPYVDRVIQQTLDECDKDGDMLVSWGLQIGNQEDFVANPYKGAVPSIELYNMFETRSELSAFIGEDSTATLWHKKAEQVKSLLYKELWLQDLGRFAYYKDPTDVVMLDGQYQTYLYPIIYNMVDEYDQYTGLRHLRDRLAGADSAVYLSNNFSWHAYGTWGMQCGLAQQPWAAAGYSDSGLNNETWKPLFLMAEWAQDINHRGSWPEVGSEPAPAYFTPPAGLYIAAVIESLFGIRQNAIEKYIELTPSFPDHWPAARLQITGFEVDYTKQGNTISYLFKNKDKDFKNISYKINWRLPVSTVTKLTVNGKEIAYVMRPGINHLVLSFEVGYADELSINLEYQPVPYAIDAPLSLAEGEHLVVSVEGAVIKKLTDRSGVFDHIFLHDMDNAPENLSGILKGQLKTGLLDKYLKFNQLGQLNFSRRTFFLDLSTPSGVSFTVPVDITVLPRFEAVAVGFHRMDNRESALEIKVRNNTESGFRNIGTLSICSLFGIFAPVKLDIAARSEQIVKVNLPENAVSWFTAGDNKAILSLPGETNVDITFQAEFSKPSVFNSISLPEKDMLPDDKWNTIREMPGFPHIFFTFTNYGWPIPMYSYKDVAEVKVAQIPGLAFKMVGQQFIPVFHLSGNAAYRLALDDKVYKKLYLLVLPFVDNHNMFSAVARISAYANKQIVYSRTLHYPGDVDYWVPDRNPTSFATFREPRPERFELLPLLPPDRSDWEEGKPPVFPQPKWWSTSIPVVAESCLMDIIEINLSRPMQLDSLVFETIGVMPAFGIVSLTGEVAE